MLHQFCDVSFDNPSILLVTSIALSVCWKDSFLTLHSDHGPLVVRPHAVLSVSSCQPHETSQLA
jgi:hypothetical protein